MRNKLESLYISFRSDFKELENELMQITKDYTAGGKLKIIDPEKSPDHADSLMLSLIEERKREAGVGGTDIQF